MSRGIDSTLIVPACGSTWKILTTSDRWPPTPPPPGDRGERPGEPCSRVRADREHVERLAGHLGVADLVDGPAQRLLRRLVLEVAVVVAGACQADEQEHEAERGEGDHAARAAATVPSTRARRRGGVDLAPERAQCVLVGSRRGQALRRPAVGRAARVDLAPERLEGALVGSASLRRRATRPLDDVSCAAHATNAECASRGQRAIIRNSYSRRAPGARRARRRRSRRCGRGRRRAPRSGAAPRAADGGG